MIDIGSNSVRLVVYESLSRSLVTVFNEKNLCGLGREVQSTGRLADDAVDARARSAAAVSRALSVDESRTHFRGGDSGVPRRIEWRGIHRSRRAYLPRTDRRALRPARSQIIGVGRRLRHFPPRRDRRRSRRRLARTRRSARHPRPQRDHPAARLAGAAGCVAEITEARRTHCQNGARQHVATRRRSRAHVLRSRRHLACARAPAYHPERLSAAGDARICDPRTGGARFRSAAAAAGAGQHSGEHRSRRRSAAPAPDLRRAGARKHHQDITNAADRRVLHLRRARGLALRNAAACRARQGRIDLRRADA